MNRSVRISGADLVAALSKAVFCSSRIVRSLRESLKRIDLRFLPFRSESHSLHVQVPHIQRIFFNELTARFDVFAHQR